MSESIWKMNELKMPEDIMQTLERKVKEIHDLLHHDYIEEASFQIENVYNQLLSSNFECALLKKSMDAYVDKAIIHVWEDMCGKFHVGPDPDDISDCCCCFGGACGVFSFSFLLEMCCPGAGISCLRASLSPCDPDSSCCCLYCCLPCIDCAGCRSGDCCGDC